jgi:hypothetical protein
VACHVDDRPARLAHEEAADAPRLVGQRVDDVEAAGHRLRVRRVHVRDLDRHVHPQHLGIARVVGLPGDDDLRRRDRRRDEHEHAALVHRDAEAEQVDVERARALGVVGVDDGDGSPDAVHYASFRTLTAVP